jgi:MoxR-like ATPase
MSFSAPPGVDPEIHRLCEEFRRDYRAVQAEIAKVIVGHEEIVDGVLTCLFVGGHALLEGVPGLGKTALIRALASALDLKFSRIQFTPDLMPADVIGTNVIMENEHGQRAFTFMAGPIFAQIVLADEINRATPKTQSAMLEAMQEKQVTAGGAVRPLDAPFFVMATQNPLEQEGTYPLPEAQLDRFFFKLVQYSGREELRTILDRTTDQSESHDQSRPRTAKIIAHQELVKRVVIAPHVQDYAIRCVLATHPQGMFAIPMDQPVPPRRRQPPRRPGDHVLAAKVRALLDGRFHVSFKDIKEGVIPAMRHRVILNFEGEAEGITTDMVLEKVISETPTAYDEDAVTVKAKA